MKKSWLLVALAATTMLASCEPAYARESSLQGNTLTIKDGAKVIVVPNVPEGLSNVDVAADLVTGRIQETPIEGPVGETTWSFNFPWITSTTEHFDKMVTFSAKGGWTHQDAPMRPVKSTEYLQTLGLFWAPAFLLMATSILLSAFGTSVKNILLFYLAVLTGVIGETLIPILGLFVGMLACGVLGGTAARNSQLGFFKGAFTGAYIGACMGIIESSTHSQTLAAQYLGFLFVVECVAFVIARVLFPSKKKAFS